MSVYTGDFLGFQLGDVHSEQLNITRVSSGDRYTDNLIPNFKDTTVEVPGGDGTYYWDTFYNQKPFIIDFAFDNLGDIDIQKLRRELGFKGIKPLIYDEFPYKKYMVKCSSPPTLKFICFDEGQLRVYKGEGTINLVAYYPYAISTNLITINEGESVIIGNKGDMDFYPNIFYSINTSNVKIECLKDEKSYGSLELENISSQGENDEYFCVNMKTHLVEGYDESFKKTGKLYNRFVTNGDFFTIPVEKSTLISTEPWTKVEYNELFY